jgi:hypothetical protein
MRRLATGTYPTYYKSAFNRYTKEGIFNKMARHLKTILVKIKVKI